MLGGELYKGLKRDFSRLGATVQPEGGVHFEGEPGQNYCLRIRATQKKSFLTAVNAASFIRDWHAVEGEPAWVTIRHAGVIRRTGLRIKTRGLSRQTKSRLNRLFHSKDFTKYALKLDFTRFELFHDGYKWRIELEFYGGSALEIRLPPTNYYVPLPIEQLKYMVKCFRSIESAISPDRLCANVCSGGKKPGWRHPLR